MISRNKVLYKINDLSIKPVDKVNLFDIHGNNKQAKVSFFLPKKEEIETIIEIAKQISKREKPVILDIGCGNGFLAYLLAKTNKVEVIGIDPNSDLIEESIQKGIYKSKNLKLEVGDSKSAIKYKDKVDIVINSWMPSGVDFTKDIKKINPKAIVYIRYKDKEKMTGKQFGLFQSYNPGLHYHLFLRWRGLEKNIIEIQLRKDIKLKELPKIKSKSKYNWEF